VILPIDRSARPMFRAIGRADRTPSTRSVVPGVPARLSRCCRCPAHRL
jgi:hypothetical protein